MVALFLEASSQMDLHLHKAFRRYDFWRPSRFWLENCALGLRHVWEESASASDLKAIVTGIWDILRSCHIAYCIKSDAWTHHISVSKIGWILVRTSFDRCVQTKARPTSFAKWESWQVVSAFCMSGDFAFLLPLVAASSSLHFFNPLQQLWRWTEWTCQGIGSTVCLDLLTTSRLPEIAELISSMTCHMFIHVPPMQLSAYAKQINGFLGVIFVAISRSAAVGFFQQSACCGLLSSLFRTK